MRFLRFLILTSSFFLSGALRAEDGYRLWLRYDLIADQNLRAAYAGAFSEIVVPENPRPIIASARDELVTGLHGLLGVDLPVVTQPTRDNALVLGTPRQPEIAALAADRPIGEPWVRKLWDQPMPGGRHRYYDGLLHMMALLECSGRFQIYAPAADQK